jgi:hypothetical protein
MLYFAKRNAHYAMDMHTHCEQIILLVSGVGTPRERSENTPEVDGNSTEATAQLMEVSGTCDTRTVINSIADIKIAVTADLADGAITSCI